MTPHTFLHKLSISKQCTHFMIDIIDIAGTESNSILLENAYNVTLAKVSGIIEGSDLRIAARADEFENSRDITIQNFTLKDCNLNENPCGKNVVFRNIKFEGRSCENICSKIIDDPVSSNRKPSTTSQCRAVFNAKISGSTLLIRLTRFSAQKKGLLYLQIISFCGQVLFQTNIADHLTEYHTDLSAFARGVYTIRYGNQARQVVWYGRN